MYYYCVVSPPQEFAETLSGLCSLIKIHRSRVEYVNEELGDAGTHRHFNIIYESPRDKSNLQKSLQSYFIKGGIPESVVKHFRFMKNSQLKTEDDVNNVCHYVAKEVGHKVLHENPEFNLKDRAARATRMSKKVEAFKLNKKTPELIMFIKTYLETREMSEEMLAWKDEGCKCSENERFEARERRQGEAMLLWFVKNEGLNPVPHWRHSRMIYKTVIELL